MEIKILKFYADWCSPCRVLGTKLDGANLPVENVNVDLSPKLVEKYNVKGVPLLVFTDMEGNEKGRLRGVVEVEQIKKVLDEYRNV